MENNFKFNYCIPREYEKDGKKQYSLVKSGETMGVDTLENICKLVDDKRPKDGQPWCQMFNNGYRNTNENLSWKDWNGFTFSDIDSKHYYIHKKQFDPMKILNAIKEVAPYEYQYNYYAVYITGSGKGFRILWYWNCDRTKENFLKCCMLTEQYTRDLFYRFGEQGKEIIDYEYKGFRVLDRCSKSIMQGMYVSGAKIFYSEFIGCQGYGSCVIDDIDISDLYKTNDITSWSGKGTQSDYIKYIKRTDINKESIKYYPHHLRRCIYEAFIVLFKDKEKVDEEWKYIANLIPESDNNGGGHPHKFYEDEPDKNRWFERFNEKEKHSLSWLKDFGYVYNDDTSYKYLEEFKKSWQKYCSNKLYDICCDIWIKANVDIDLSIHDKNVIDDIDDMGMKEDYIKFLNELKEKTALKGIFSEYIDDLCISITEDMKRFKFEESIDDIRSNYYKERWKESEFKYLCGSYKIPKDIITYVMYADFHYRDENNIPQVKYNVLEDQIDTYGYWPENNQIQWHVMKFNNEYVDWRNHDKFHYQASRNDMMFAINRYVVDNYLYHPIKDYLNSLDLSIANEDVLETWAIKLFKAEDTELTRTISKNFFIAAVKKIFVDDPTKFVFQHILFLKGATGCGKTHFLVKMFTIDGHSYILNKINPDDPDNIVGPLVAKNWLIQFGEGGKLKKADVDTQKEFVDRINLGMKYQKKYENEQTTVYPRIVCVRTTNNDDLFNDVSINEGDRRNWLIVCNNEANAGSNPELKKQMDDIKDIIWATAYKLYLDNPDMDLELNDNMFKELGKMQEDYKLVKNDEIKEIYENIFGRKYLTNDKSHIQNEKLFMDMLEFDDNVLGDIAEDPRYKVAGGYKQKNCIYKIPGTWLNNYIRKKYDGRFWTLLKKYMIDQSWVYKNAGYNNKVMKCWCYDGPLGLFAD